MSARQVPVLRFRKVAGPMPLAVAVCSVERASMDAETVASRVISHGAGALAALERLP